MRLVATFTAFLVAWAASFAMASAREPMWVIEKDGTRVYLVGSMHVLPKSVSPKRPALIKAFNDSRRVVFEISTDAGTNADVYRFFQKHGLYRPPDKLERHLTPEAKQLVDAALPVFKLRWQDVQNHKPWLLGLRLQRSLMKSRGFAAAQGVDEYFESLARKKHKPVGGLESTQEHLGFFIEQSDAEQSTDLVNNIVGLVWLRYDLEAMGRLWELGATEAFEQGLAPHQATKSGRRLFRDRNVRWVPKIVRLIEGKENTMVIVGMGHLVGKDGLVRLLRAKGYSVRQM